MMSATLLLAYDPNDVKPGWVALLIVLALAVATYLLWRSMNNQMRKIQMPPRGTSPRGTFPSDPTTLGDDDTDKGQPPGP